MPFIHCCVSGADCNIFSFLFYGREIFLVVIWYLLSKYYICTMEISKSIFGLAKSNNGFFKSEKQAKFLSSKIDDLDGCIGHANSGYNSCPIFASYDDKGITKIIKSTKNGDVLMFERKNQGVLTSLEAKEIKRLERKLKALKMDIDEREDSFKSGNYNGSGDTSTYTDDMIERFNHFQTQYKEQALSIENRIKTIKNEN